ncbi:hypothetical protein AB3G45_10725 [Shinella sp. S4-D37]|uniref:hypothetical protein n=1 Tax=Shinella sp. S4-D37 TaxID=3161999 RepID=UPI003466C7AD
MTALTDPTTASVFTVGKNQRNGFDAATVGSHEHYVNTLFNRGPETCRQLYDRMVGAPSPTRKNTDALVTKLRSHGISEVLETNVICYSTPMSSDLRKLAHLGGTERGQEIFAVLLDLIQPRVLISHGADTAKKLSRILQVRLPAPPTAPSDPLECVVGGTTVFIIPSLAPPQFNKWSRWSEPHLEKVCERVGLIMRQQ